VVPISNAIVDEGTVVIKLIHAPPAVVAMEGPIALYHLIVKAEILKINVVLVRFLQHLQEVQFFLHIAWIQHR